MNKSDPWYIHAILYAVILFLVFILVKVAIIDPTQIVETDKYNKKESRLRMKNLREAEILWEKKHGSFTANLDSLITFVKNDPFVDSVRNAFDSLSNKRADPFMTLSSGQFSPDSLYKSPKSGQKYIVQVDTTTSVDTIYTPSNKIKRVDTLKKVGTRYLIEDPDGYGAIGDIESDAKKNTASWE